MRKTSKVLEFPELRQTFNYDCCASALQSVLVYYGIEKRENELMKLLNTTEADGTKLADLKKTIEYYGLECKMIKGMTPEDIVNYIKKKTPVIVLLQAWRDFDANPNWKEDYNDGHFVVAIGYDINKIIFDDPASFCRTYLTFDELRERWHDTNDNNIKDPDSIGIVVVGQPTFKMDKCIHMD
jgi:predicted double-glycine peptidase